MKRLFPYLIVLILATAFTGEEQDFEGQLKAADSYWLARKYKKAEKEYSDLILSQATPREYRSLVYLRLAELQLQTGKKKDCLKTLDEMKLALSRIREHHLMRMEELRLLANNQAPVYKTPLPIHGRVAATIYVSQRSQEGGDGSEKNPFNSIEEAVTHVCKNSSLYGKGTIEILLNDDHYIFQNTINFTERDQKKISNPVIIRSVNPKNKTQIDGGIMLRSLKTETDPQILALLPEHSRGKVLVAELKDYGIRIPDLEMGGTISKRLKVTNYSGFGELPKKRDVHHASLPVPQLFYDGTMLPMARWPNENDTSIVLERFHSPRAEQWNMETDVWLHGYWGYQFFDCFNKFKSYSKESGIKLEAPYSYDIDESMIRKGYYESRWTAWNLLSEMDEPGEWKISVPDGKIWILPPEDFDPAKCVLSVKTGPVFFADHFDNLTFKDLSFTNLRGDGIIANSSNRINIINCEFKDLSGVSIQVFGGYDHLIHSCLIEGMGRGGIEMAGGELDRLVSSGAIIENCIFRDISRLERTYTQAIWASGVGTKIQHCLFEDMPSTAVRIEGNDMLLQFNEFTRCVYESNDQGAFETYMNYLYRGNVVRWNYFHELGGPEIERGAGVRLDDLISGFCIDGNIFRRSSSGIFGAISINRGIDNVVENNIIIDCNAGISVWEDSKEKWSEELRRYNNGYTFNQEKSFLRDSYWLQRYPEIDGIINSEPSANFFIDNAFINTKIKYIRELTLSDPLNDREINDNHVDETLIKYKKYLVPWHPIPLGEIGVY